MSGYVACRWPVEDVAANRAAARIERTALKLGWRSLVDAEGWRVFAHAAGPLAGYAAVGRRAAVIGRLFDRDATDHGDVADGRLPTGSTTFALLCDHLTRKCWGGYVALGINAQDPSRLDIYRDPVGMLDCCHWRSGAMTIVSSKPEAFLADAPPDDLAIDWEGVATLLRFAGAAGDALPMRGVTAVPPGGRVELSWAGVTMHRHWSPASFAFLSAPDPSRDLSATIDACVRAWATTSQTTIAELSGGLDSAIVAESLARAGAPVAGWFHYHAIDREGDERLYARAVADHLHLDLTETFVGHRVIDAALMADVPVTLRPNVASLSLVHDCDLSARGRALGAETLMTGQGGDALFYQPATSLIAADLWRDARPWRHKGAVIVDLAAWTGLSVWSVLAAALRARLAPAPVAVPNYRIDLVSSDMPGISRPVAWLDDTADLPPAKQLQILNLAAARGAFGGSWCASAMTVLHPLMSQPLIETFLPIPALDLTKGKRDRAMVRNAYRGRLPELLLDRRSKGSLTPFFGRMLAASVPFLRDYLLDGVMVSQQVLDRDRTDAILHADHIMQVNCYTELLVALLMERWARAWTSRIAPLDTGLTRRHRFDDTPPPDAG